MAVISDMFFSLWKQNLLLNMDCDMLTISDQAALLAAFVAVSSFSVVYQLFSLQTWLTRSLQILDRSESVALQYPLKSIERTECVRQSATHLKAYPKLNFFAIGVVQLVLGWLTVLANAAGPLAPVFMLTPAAVLLTVFFGASFLVWHEGKKYHSNILFSLGVS
jgi:hypothetical protein